MLAGALGVPTFAGLNDALCGLVLDAGVEAAVVNGDFVARVLVVASLECVGLHFRHSLDVGWKGKKMHRTGPSVAGVSTVLEASCDRFD